MKKSHRTRPITVFAFLGVTLFAPLLNAKPNLVLILTDDQRWDTMWAMPIVEEKLTARGVVFEQAYVTTPLCCPDRASTLSGGFYAHNTGVLTNIYPAGGVDKFNDNDTLATQLQAAGYHTALLGKYMNGYRRRAPYIPPGWTVFAGSVREPSWFEHTVAIGSSGTEASRGRLETHSQYLTDFYRDRALAFLDEYGQEPFFMYFSTHAPHGPATPASGDEGAFLNYRYEDRAYREPDLTDKPAFIQDRAALNQELERAGALPFNHSEEFPRLQLASLQAVDRAVGAIVDKIESLGQMGNTVFVFTSDNGVLWGEHWLWTKSRPYQEAVRVPFVLVAPGVEPGKDTRLIAANLDIGATFYDLAGVDRVTDGRSLLPLLSNADDPGRREIFFEGYRKNTSFKALLTRLRRGRETWKLIQHDNGESELYELTSDAFEEHNLANDPAYEGVVGKLGPRLNPFDPVMIRSEQPPAGKTGQPYRFRLRTFGGNPPFRWRVLSKGRLPAGLSLDSDTGEISGTPSESGEIIAYIRVKDSSYAKHRRKRRYHAMKFTFEIAP